MSTLCKTVTVSCTVLALLLFGVTVLIAIQGPASAATPIDPATGSENDTPFEFWISSERPRSVDGVNKVEVSRDVHLSVNEMTLNHYDVYYTDEGGILALHFTTGGKRVDLSKILVGLGLRGKSGDLVMTAGGSLWALVYTPQQPDPIRQGPFTLWVVFDVDLDALAKVNGEAFAREAAEPYVEVYLSDRPEGLTYAGYDGPTDNTSPFIQITDIRPFRRE